MNTSIFSAASLPPELVPQQGPITSSTLEISVRRDGQAPRTVSVPAELPAAVGRDSSCPVCIDDHHISRRHLVLHARGDRLTVEDTSSNGTLAGERLLRREAADVPFGTPILVGAHTLIVRRRAAATAGDTVPPTELPSAQAQPLEPAPPRVSATERESGADLRREIHRRLLQHLDLANLESTRLDDPSFRPRVLTALRRIVKTLENELPPGIDPNRLVGEMADEALGLGPLESLLADPEVSEIMVVDANTIYVEKQGKLSLTDVRFTDEARVRAVVERIVTPLGRRIDESSPLVDARLPDGSRVNAIIRPLAIRGSCITIRKFSRKPLTLRKLVELGTLSEAMGRFLTRSVVAKRNILISGGTGSGKTTLLNVLSTAIPEGERIVTIEDSAELQLEQPHVVALETRSANMEGKGDYSMRDLVRNALRMRPDRIVVGECRGGEALDMLQAMNTGHDGSLTTTHANSAAEALARLETLVLMAGIDLPARAIREQIASSIQVIVQQTRLADGSRKVTAIAELSSLGPDGDFVLRPIYVFSRTGTGPEGQVLGEFSATGCLPSFLNQFIVRGLVRPGEPYL
jgi:pilus assembly protein CpaF